MPSVGYRPVITWLPQGTIMGVRVVMLLLIEERVIIGGQFWLLWYSRSKDI